MILLSLMLTSCLKTEVLNAPIEQAERFGSVFCAYQDISSLATKAEVNAKQDAILDLNTRLAALGATAIQSVKTINGQSIVGEGNITIEGGGVSEEYVNNAIASAITNTLNTAV